MFFIKCEFSINQGTKIHKKQQIGNMQAKHTSKLVFHKSGLSLQITDNKDITNSNFFFSKNLKICVSHWK
jgi:hypothetical protein